MKTLRPVVVAAALAAVVLPKDAGAHDIWVVPVKQDNLMVAHVRYADPARLELADFRKIVSLELITPAGRTNLKRPLTQTTGASPALVSKPFAPPPPASVLAVTFDNGFWSVDPSDSVEPNTSKLLIPNPKESWWVPKFGKTLLGPGAYQVRTQALLELVPLADPYTLGPGQTLQVRVELRGKPVTGVEVTYTDGIAAIPEKDRPHAVTNAEGVAAIPMVRKGAYLLTTQYITAPTVPQLADKDELYATLAFDTSN
ncbi:MAG TPA: DUF4198 domain-containing protein [Caulobacteraceae bacterium]|jgi:uncharacterized GH25 family protein|nr:DUF4198 domain-containing protein [Caulobacteraceae bacterium]